MITPFDEDLATLLRERSAGPPANPGRPRDAVELGRRMLRRQRARRAVTMVAGATAAALGTVLVAGGDGADRFGSTGVRPVSVRLPAEVALPNASRGLVSGTLPLAESRYRTHTGKVTLRFVPLSRNTMSNVRCADPRAWLIIRVDSPGRSASVGRCGTGDHLTQFDAASAGNAWVGRPHTWEVWVLPAQTKITPDRSPAKPDANDTLAAEPGAWAVGIYDTP